MAVSCEKVVVALHLQSAQFFLAEGLMAAAAGSERELLLTAGDPTRATLKLSRVVGLVETGSMDIPHLMSTISDDYYLKQKRHPKSQFPS